MKPLQATALGWVDLKHLDLGTKTETVFLQVFEMFWSHYCWSTVVVLFGGRSNAGKKCGESIVKVLSFVRSRVEKIMRRFYSIMISHAVQ